jgi:WD repeat-containing protein 19
MTWSFNKTQTFDVKMKNADFMIFSSDSSHIVIGNDKGNLLFLDLFSSSESMVIVGKHSKSIISGASWNDQIALASDDKTITVSSLNGDTLNTISKLKGTPDQLSVRIENLTFSGVYRMIQTYCVLQL